MSLIVEFKTLEQDLRAPAGADLEQLGQAASAGTGGFELFLASGSALKLEIPRSRIPWLQGCHTVSEIAREIDSVLNLFDDGSYVVVLDIQEAVFYRFEKSGNGVLYRSWNPMADGHAYVPFGSARLLNGIFTW